MVEEFQRITKRALIRESEDMLQMAQEELLELQKEIAQLEIELQRLLLPKDPEDTRNAYLEIRAGTEGMSPPCSQETCSGCTPVTVEKQAGAQNSSATPPANSGATRKSF
jgi:hypothetical protein